MTDVFRLRDIFELLTTEKFADFYCNGEFAKWITEEPDAMDKEAIVNLIRVMLTKVENRRYRND